MAEEPKAKPAKEEAPKPEAPASGEPQGPKKISRMTFAELEAAIIKCRQQMGGLWSRYGKSLADHRASWDGKSKK